jgi:hypothetical protein
LSGVTYSGIAVNAQIKNALTYIKNAGGSARVDHFDEDYEPIGHTLRKELTRDSFIYEHESRIWLREKGEAALSEK